MKKSVSEIFLPDTPAGAIYTDSGEFTDFGGTAAGIKLERMFGDFADVETVSVNGNVTKTLTVVSASVPRTLTLLFQTRAAGFVVKNVGTANCILSSANLIDGSGTFTLPPGDSVTVIWLNDAKTWIVI